MSPAFSITQFFSDIDLEQAVLCVVMHGSVKWDHTGGGSYGAHHD